MHDAEPMKPSNTGWLIADVVQETFAFGWSRVEVDAGLQALLRDPQWQPYVVFPGEFVEPPERVIHTLPEEAVGTMDAAQHGKRPLFILLDATWNEARKMFRKSPYLNDLPVLSLQPEQISHYKLRRSNREDHFCTSEVAALCLQMCRDARDVQAGHVLEHYLTVYTHHYLRAKSQLPPEPEGAAHQGLAAALRQTQPS
jgi:DTW domain-containing protein